MGILDLFMNDESQAIVNLIKAWHFFLTHELVVGITAATAGRSGGANNAALAYLHTNGSPAHNIPPRPFLEPAIMNEEVYEQIKSLMMVAAEAALIDGDISRCEQAWEMAGLFAAQKVKEYIAGGVPPPNRPSTIRRKGSSTPLVDTGQLMNSITYEVRKK